MLGDDNSQNDQNKNAGGLNHSVICAARLAISLSVAGLFAQRGYNAWRKLSEKNKENAYSWLSLRSYLSVLQENGLMLENQEELVEYMKFFLVFSAVYYVSQRPIFKSKAAAWSSYAFSCLAYAANRVGNILQDLCGDDSALLKAREDAFYQLRISGRDHETLIYQPYHARYYANTDLPQIKNDWICTITRELMREPVYLPSDGCHYERSALTEFYRRNPGSLTPLGKSRIDLNKLYNNCHLQLEITTFIRGAYAEVRAQRRTNPFISRAVYDRENEEVSQAFVVERTLSGC